MADLKEVNNVTGNVEGSGTSETTTSSSVNSTSTTESASSSTSKVFKKTTVDNAGTIQKVGSKVPTTAGFWSKFKAFWLQEIDWNQEIKVELTPYQQKIEDEINEFLHQEITWEKVHDFLFQEISFKRK